METGLEMGEALRYRTHYAWIVFRNVLAREWKKGNKMCQCGEATSTIETDKKLVFRCTLRLRSLVSFFFLNAEFVLPLTASFSVWLRMRLPAIFSTYEVS